MVKKAKKISNILNVKCIADNKTFWKIVKPCFSKKSTRNEKISLVEENKVIITDKTVAEKLSSYLETFAENINLQNKAARLTNDDSNEITINFESHPSIIKIVESISKNLKFSFSSVTRNEVETKIILFDPSKSQPFYNISTKVVKVNRDIFSNFITCSFNTGISISRP